MKKAEDRVLIAKMQTYLHKQQFVDPWIPPHHPAYGGWGFGESHLSPGFVGHVDLSNTRKILQALRDSGFDMRSIQEQAQVFLDRCQNKGFSEVFDGGFYYSPVLLGTNKAGLLEAKDSTFARSYATATCDGILALLALDSSSQDERLQKAREWLTKEEDWDLPGGIPKDHPQDWAPTLRLYHMAVRAEAYQALGIEGEWRKDLFRALEGFQREDGSFVNPKGARNKENDPLLATTLAVRA
ncbi:MAG: hypothetical protein AAFU64_16200, partial [Bacteroidota bacterium]